MGTLSSFLSSKFANNSIDEEFEIGFVIVRSLKFLGVRKLRKT